MTRLGWVIAGLALVVFTLLLALPGLIPGQSVIGRAPTVSSTLLP